MKEIRRNMDHSMYIALRSQYICCTQADPQTKRTEHDTDKDTVNVMSITDTECSRSFMLHAMKNGKIRKNSVLLNNLTFSPRAHKIRRQNGVYLDHMLARVYNSSFPRRRQISRNTGNLSSRHRCTHNQSQNALKITLKVDV